MRAVHLNVDFFLFFSFLFKDVLDQLAENRYQ